MFEHTPTWSPRRVVTGHDSEGNSTIVSEGPPLVETAIPHDGVTFFEIWSTGATPAPVSAVEPDPTDGPVVVPPPRAGTRIRINEMQPGHLREGRQSPWHRTETIDYAIVLEGELVLRLDDGVEVVLNAGDVVVQRGTNHTWVNRSPGMVRVAYILIDGAFTDELKASLGEEALAHVVRGPPAPTENR